MLHYHETDSDVVHTSFDVTNVIVNGMTAVGQHVMLLENPHFGKMLFLDGESQSAERDEHTYHEPLVHPALMSRPGGRVLVIGGAEGATLREVLKHASVTEVVVCDYDAELVGLCRVHCSSWHQGSWDDPRARYVAEDIRKYVVEHADDQKFDTIIVDLCDSFILDAEFLTQLRELLAPDGRISLQAGAISVLPVHLDRVRALRDTLERVFDMKFTLYTKYQVFFQSLWAFMVSGDDLASFDATIPCRSLDGPSYATMATLDPTIRI
jgi:spermidine synthase